ncbi:MAG: lipid-A-disaccharide synthase [Flavobacteriaceae bacterium]|nr:lipid-A-disaccharide synthase [Flavobacteriaceae bacterium]|tara:strand:+ start:45527 stop:46648 length:1122 start_codon:yes stop_codon:yes gene_type:complete
MKYYLIAGEASGDLHGANLMKALKAQDPQADFRFWGGDLMKDVGGEQVKHYRDLAFMGFIEVVFNLRTILKNISFCKKDIEAYQPDAIIFIDYPGFNLRIAKWAKQKGFATHYYISPQIWAWKENRIKSIKRDVDFMYVILPFEKEFYEKKHGFPVHFVGHPLIDAIARREQVVPSVFKKEHGMDERPIIALLPGSRKQEISKMLKVMLSVVENFSEFQFVIAGAPSQEASFYEPFLKKQNVHLLLNKTYDLLSISHAALVTSGTATLETALFKVPQVVCYKGSRVSYEIAKRVINLNYISLVNLILDKPAVVELIQTDFNTKRVNEELTQILDEYNRAVLFLDYYDLEKELGGKGASDKTAQLIVAETKNKT